MEVYQSERTAEELEFALGAVPSIGANGNWFIGGVDTGVYAGGVKVEGATPDQIIKIAEVDELGRPTAWEPIDMKLDWNLLDEFVLEEDVVTAEFELSEPATGEIMIQVSIVPPESITTNAYSTIYFTDENGVSESYMYANGIYVGTIIDIWFVREYHEGWVSPIVKSLRYGGSLPARNSIARPPVTISNVNLASNNASVPMGAGTVVKVYKR